MKNFSLLLILVFLIPCLGQEEGERGKLKIILTGFENDKGTARLALCNSRENYESEEQAYRSSLSSISNRKSYVVLDSLPYGEYAIKVYHDENEDKELDTNFLGVPSEVYGFSNNARGSYGPADWKEAKFLFSSPWDSLTIVLQ